MSNSVLISGDANVANLPDNGIFYLPPAGKFASASTTEANRELPIRDAGVFSNLYTYVSSNTINATPSLTVTFRVNRAASSVTLQYATTETGIKEDTSNTATVAATDEIGCEYTCASVAGSQNVFCNVTGVQFAPTNTANTITILKCVNTTHSTASSTFDIPPNGNAAGNTDSSAVLKLATSATSSDLYAFVSVNGRSTNSTITTKVNAGAGSQSLTYTAAETGAKEDSVASDSLVSTDSFAYSVTLGTGTGNFNPNMISTSFITTTHRFPLTASDATALSFAINVTSYMHITASMTTSTTEANAQFRPRFNQYVKDLEVNLSANTFTTANMVARVRDGGANGNLSVTYAAAETGVKTDSDTDTISSGTDFEGYQFVTDNSGSGTASLLYIQAWGQDTSTDTVTTKRLAALGVG